MKKSSKPSQKDLYEAAAKARKNSYSPYSRFAVGAAILTEDGEVFTGCNVENASFGGSVCAERVAIQKAVSERGKIRIAQLMVVTDSNPPAAPCGLCRQVIAEFGKNSTIHFANLDGKIRTLQLKKILPEAFYSFEPDTPRKSSKNTK